MKINNERDNLYWELERRRLYQKAEPDSKFGLWGWLFVIGMVVLIFVLEF